MYTHTTDKKIFKGLKIELSHQIQPEYRREIWIIFSRFKLYIESLDPEFEFSLG